MFENRNEYIHLPMDEIVERYNNKEGLRSLADRYGVSHETIRKRLLEEGVTLRPRGKELGQEDIKLPKKDLASLYKRGFSVKELAKMYNVSYTLIYSRLEKMGIELIDPRTIRMPEEELIDLYNQGVSQYKLAKKFGVSAMTINRRLKKLGVTARYKNTGKPRN